MDQRRQGRGDISMGAQVEGGVVGVLVTKGSRRLVRKAEGCDMPESSFMPEMGCKGLRCRNLQQWRGRASLCQARATETLERAIRYTILCTAALPVVGLSNGVLLDQNQVLPCTCQSNFCEACHPRWRRQGTQDIQVGICHRVSSRNW